MSDRATHRRRVLVVDDNRDLTRSLSLLLKMKGDEVEIANDGIEAVQKASSYKPDTVLLDLGLPGLDGYEVCRAIRKNLAQEKPIVVALSGWAQEQDRIKSREAGFDGHLIKPVDLDKLYQLLDSLQP